MKRKMNKDTVTFVLAGGIGSRLYELTKYRAKPGVFFAGYHRIIDFVLSNLINSGFGSIKVLTQAKFHSIERHVKRVYSQITGTCIETLRASKLEEEKNWYKGTADAVFQNIAYLKKATVKYAAIFAGDHIFSMDISQFLDALKGKDADFMICAKPVLVEKAAGRFGVIEVDENYRIIAFEEKPEKPNEIPGKPGYCLASMGNFMAKEEVLSKVLIEDSIDSDSSHDFSYDIIPKLLREGYNIFVYNFDENKIEGQDENYWRDVGTIEAYMEANMDSCEVKPKIGMYNYKNWPIRRDDFDLLPAHKGGIGIQSNDALICDGCITNGCKIFKSVLGPGVIVEKGSEIIGSVIFPNVKIEENVQIRNAVIDSNVVISRATKIGHSEEDDNAKGIYWRYGIAIVPKNFVFSK